MRAFTKALRGLPMGFLKKQGSECPLVKGALCHKSFFRLLWVFMSLGLRVEGYVLFRGYGFTMLTRAWA